jgi:hypothetical protein
MNSTKAISAFATLRFVGDALEPDEISNTIKQKPTRAYRKGERYKPGPRSPELTGKTGIWYLSTDGVTSSNDLKNHIGLLIRLISPFGDNDQRLRKLREIIDKRNLRAHVTFFWRGAPGTERPSIPSVDVNLFKRLPADIETDFDIENEEPLSEPNSGPS